jgi:hypothetical protein
MGCIKTEIMCSLISMDIHQVNTAFQNYKDAYTSIEKPRE